MDAVSIAPATTTASARQMPQHMQALARANRVRLARAELKRSIGRGEVEVADVIRDCPWETESMTLAELLTSQRRWGRTRARKLLQALALNGRSDVIYKMVNQDDKPGYGYRLKKGATSLTEAWDANN